MPKYRVTAAGARGSANTAFILEADDINAASNTLDSWQQYTQIIIDTNEGTDSHQRATINTPYNYGIVLGDDDDQTSAVHVEDDRLRLGVTDDDFAGGDDGSDGTDDNGHEGGDSE